MKKLSFIILFISASAEMAAFQNCSKITFGIQASGDNPGQQTTSTVPTTPSGTPTTITPEPPATTSGITLQSIRPVFAVRGANCLVCHGSMGSTLVSDFGYGSANFITTQSFWGSRTAFNDGNSGNSGGTFESLQVQGGSLIVPQISLSVQDANTMFGLSDAPTSFADIFKLPNPNAWGSMQQGIVPAVADQAPVITYSSIAITYPSEKEILNLVPANLKSNTAAVAPVASLPGISRPAQLSGLTLDSSGNFIRNSAGSVQCYGDVVVKGPLFLNNLQLQTDAGGCRLYVTQTVFIQGPITYLGTADQAAASNLQITSARAIVMGISAQQMGASILNLGPSGIQPSAPSRNRTNDNVLKTPGGPWTRFAVALDSQYNPGNAPINGVETTDFFDSLVADALLIGSELQDAGDAAAVSGASLIPGESLIDETGGDNDGNRVAINYTGLILNAPHVHSRYLGSFSGAIIADVAMLARNPASSSVNGDFILQFSFDSRLNSVSSVFPALTTTILRLTP